MASQDVNFKSTSDGWRGTLAQNFTQENVERVAKAISLYLTKKHKEKSVVIGYDTRFMSEDFAIFIASVFQRYGINSIIIQRPSTTPLLTFTTFSYKFALGINITASHNPPFDNGIKIRMNYGGTPNEEIIDEIESYLGSESKITKTKGVIKFIDPRKRYIKTLRKILDYRCMRNSKVKVLVDTMHGATAGTLGEVFEKSAIQVDYLHKNFDPYFGGINPEPKFEATSKLQLIINKGEYNFGIAHDGDGDRIVAALPKIGYLSPHDVSAILVLYLGKYKRLKGKILGSSTLGRRVKRISEHLNLPYETMPVGFKNATQQMLDRKVLLAAEENGGLGFGFYLPERDATLAAALLVEAEAKIGLRSLYKEAEKIAGKSGFCRYNYAPKADRRKLFLRLLKSSSCFDYRKVESVSTMDGLKITYENGDWVSIRFSGTEDVIRIYSESESRDKALNIKNFVLKKIKNIERDLI